MNFWATLAKFWPSSGHKITENGGFRPSSEKVFIQSNSNLACTLIVWVFRIDSLLGQAGQNLALWWPKNDWKWWFPTIIWKSIHAIQFKLGVYTYWLSVQNWIAFGPCWPNFGPTVVTKRLKLVVSVIWKTIQTIQFKLGVYTCWVSFHNWFDIGTCWPNFGHLVAKKINEIGWKW